MQRGRNGQQVEYENLLYHVILPRVLPENYPNDHEQQEETLLSLLVDTVAKSSNSIPSATVRFFQSLKRTHHQGKTSESITKEINELKPGDIFAMFICRQNTAFMIHMPKEQDNANQINSVTVATFTGNFHPREIYEHQNDLLVNDSNSNLLFHKKIIIIYFIYLI